MGMFDFLGGVLGTNNNYNVNDPYGQGAVQQQLNNQGQVYGEQQALAGQLQQQAAGQGPSVSAQILQNAQAQNANAMNSAIAGNRGVNAGMALKQGMDATANANQAAAGTAAAGRIQEQMNAQSGLGNLYGTMGNQSIASQNVMNNANNGANGINANVAAGNQQTNSKLAGGAMNAAGGLMGLAHGGVVPGHASVPGDSYANDKVPVMLSPGELVVDRDHMGSPEMAKEFIDHLMSQRGPSKKGSSYQGVLEAHRKLGEALAAMDKKGSKK